MADGFVQRSGLEGFGCQKKVTTGLSCVSVCALDLLEDPGGGGGRVFRR